MSTAHGGYYVPHTSYWPMVGCVGVMALVGGFASFLVGAGWGLPVSLVGLVIIVLMMIGWFGDVIREKRQGLYNDQMERSFRWGMIWFIFSEVMFFGAFFGALFYARVLSIPWLGGEDPATSRFIWDSVALAWPTAGPGFLDLDFQVMGAWGLPAINTAILLTSGVTLTIAHHAIKEDHHQRVVWGLVGTIVLGTVFLGIQMYEYVHAYQDLNLRLDTGIYGSTFFMLTGFHGVHVFIGAVMLAVMLVRVLKRHFTADDHFGFEAAAWYWHFVDVVWLILFVFVYVL